VPQSFIWQVYSSFLLLLSFLSSFMLLIFFSRTAAAETFEDSECLGFMHDESPLRTIHIIGLRIFDGFNCILLGFRLVKNGFSMTAYEALKLLMDRADYCLQKLARVVSPGYAAGDSLVSRLAVGASDAGAEAKLTTRLFEGDSLVSRLAFGASDAGAEAKLTTRLFEGDSRFPKACHL
jgi:hypothetical protein